MGVALQVRPAPGSTLRAPGLVSLPTRVEPGLVSVPTATDLVAARSVPVPASALPRRSPVALLGSAHAGVVEAAAASDPAERYVRAHLAALRAASAVVAARARPSPTRRGGSPSVWSLLTAVAPDLGEWAAFFAAGARTRAAAESGFPHVVTARAADDLLRDVQTFLGLVEGRLGSIRGALDGAPGSVLPFAREA